MGHLAPCYAAAGGVTVTLRGGAGTTHEPRRSTRPRTTADSPVRYSVWLERGPSTDGCAPHTPIERLGTAPTASGALEWTGDEPIRAGGIARVCAGLAHGLGIIAGDRS